MRTPCGNGIRCHFPPVREGITRSECTIGKQDYRVLRGVQPRGSRNPEGREVPPVLFHGSYCHPVSGGSRDTGVPHQFCKFAPARDNKHRKIQFPELGTDFSGKLLQAAADLQDKGRAYSGHLSQLIHFRQVNNSLSLHISEVSRILLLVVWVLICPVAGVLITEFCPDPYLPDDRDEYLRLEGSGSLDGIVVTDGEGGFRFPAGTMLQGSIVIAMDAEDYRSSHGVYPDFEWNGGTPEVPDVIRTGRFQLSNGHDQLELYSGDICLQRVEWPETVTTRQGQVHFLSDGSWDGRVLMLGQSRFEAAIFYNASGIAFVSPDCAREIFSETAGNAKHEILVSIYEMTSPVLARDLEDAHRRGVRVEVLVEGGPVGGIPEEEHMVISSLVEAGIPVRMMSGTRSVHSPYRFLHSKYMVIDSRRVLITSENFKEHGFPETGRRGNRGWGVVITHTGLAEYFRSVYTHDAQGAWTIAAVPEEGYEEVPSWQEYPAEYSPYVFSGATVTPVLSPDTSDLLHPLILSAERSVDIEMAYISNETDLSLNPFIADAVNVSRRGIPVRVLLDSFYYNVEGEDDNDEMASVLNGIAATEGLPLEVRCADLSPGILEKIHNKGVIVDQKKVLVSSINWNQNSPTFNREAGVIIDHPGVGAYYTRVFERDWHASEESEPARGPDLSKAAAAGMVIGGLLSFAWYRKIRER